MERFIDIVQGSCIVVIVSDGVHVYRPFHVRLILSTLAS
jgi:hypothetical protein